MSRTEGGKYVTGLLVISFFGAVIVLYAADLLLKARARARRMREMSQRLTAATDRAERQQQRRQAAAHASVALTSVLPAITRPPGDPAHRPEPDHPAPHAAMAEPRS